MCAGVQTETGKNEQRLQRREHRSSLSDALAQRRLLMMMSKGDQWLVNCNIGVRGIIQSGPSCQLQWNG